MRTFIGKGPKENEQRITVEPFLNAKILRVDGRRVGHALQNDQVQEVGYFLATALPDLEALFTESLQQERLLMSLSPQQQRVYNFIKGYASSNHGETPTLAEIGQRFQMKSSASVHKHIVALEKKGMITRVPNVSRGIRLVENGNSSNGEG